MNPSHINGKFYSLEQHSFISHQELLGQMDSDLYGKLGIFYMKSEYFKEYEENAIKMN
jgi:hypothetical protein